MPIFRLDLTLPNLGVASGAAPPFFPPFLGASAIVYSDTEMIRYSRCPVQYQRKSNVKCTNTEKMSKAMFQIESTKSAMCGYEQRCGP